jgi:regulatory protein
VATPTEIRKVAIALLTRRDHSRRELNTKLARRGFPSDLVEQVLTSLAAEGLQSDLRFTESFANAARGKGYGLVRIRASLRERGVDDSIINTKLAFQDTDWLAEVERVRSKRFGSDVPQDAKEWARQARFLQYRGFSAEQIRKALKQKAQD